MSLCDVVKFPLILYDFLGTLENGEFVGVRNFVNFKFKYYVN